MFLSVSDPVAATLRTALDGLELRQSVAADNIANMDTPNFIATEVGFEDSLRSAISDGSITRGPVSPSSTSSSATPGADGNNVDLAAETMTAMRATFSYQLLTRAVGDRASLITTAIGGM